MPKKLNFGLAEPTGELCTLTNVLGTQTFSQLSLLSQGELSWKCYPICFSWNPEKFGNIVEIYQNWALVGCGVEGIIAIVLSKYVRVEDPDFFILDGSLKIKIWEPPVSLHWLVNLHGTQHLNIHVPFYDELTF